MSILEGAIAYLARGWFVVPVKPQQKKPFLKGWPRLRLTAETAPPLFANGENVGLILGEPSGWLIDIDIDHLRAAELAPQFLPPTPAVYGRPGKPRSHWLYRVTGPVATRKISSKSAGMVIELKSTGQQSVAPPSIHESGEPITWEVEGAEPALADPEALLNAVLTIGNQVRVELGERPAKKEKKPKAGGAELKVPVEPVILSPEERRLRCLRAMLGMATPDHNDGSLRLFAAACRSVEHGLDDFEAIEVIREYARQRPFPQDWSDDDIRQRLRDAEKKCERGAAFAREKDGTVRLGNTDPETGKLVLSPRRVERRR